MEGGSGVDASPAPDQSDKSRVMDVKPLRSLMPVFPNGKQSPPFVCAPPFGPFPSGFSPFYPFSSTRGEYQTPPDLNQNENASFATPLRSYRNPGVSNGDASHQMSTSSKRKERRARNRDSTLPTSGGRRRSNADFDSGISLPEKENGSRELVVSILMRFDAVRRRVSQLEDSKEAAQGLIKRPDLKAGTVIMSKGIRTNMKKRVGVVPGVEIGDIFFFRMEMCLVGLHSPSMAGIDYMVLRGDTEEDLLATSIVSSGYYDNDAEDPEILVYSGHGGTADKDKQASDQKLERGNLALERSLRRDSVVRVIRGVKEIGNQTKIYFYDGLYAIKNSWVEKAKSGCNIFKYKLARLPGQPPAFAVWKAIRKWKGDSASRAGLILPDLTSGAERIPVALVNDVDNEKGPGYFTYSPTVKYLDSIKFTQPSFGCSCSSACEPGNLNCSCIRKNGGDFPYTVNGVLVCRKPMIYECSPSCPCFANCKNKVSQTGLRFRFEVFKTLNRGWGLRSWDPIRAGSFICEYAGELKNKSKLGDNDDDYAFDTSRVYSSFKWNFEPGLVEDDPSEETSEEFNIPSPFIISAKNFGNVARFMNHSCSPNVFWQPIVHELESQSCVRIAFFAMRHIPPMTELTYEYGFSHAHGTPGSRNLYGKKKCLCGSEKCRGSFG